MSDWTDDTFKRFWKAMGDIYGTAWYAAVGPEPAGNWKLELQSLSLERVRETVKHFRGVQMMPDLITFMAKAREGMPTPNPVTVNKPKLKMGNAKRSVFKPGESFRDYQDAMHKSGLTKAEFDRQRLKENGWIGDKTS